jgi:DNA polymerase-1
MIYLVSNRLFDGENYKIATCQDVLDYFKWHFEIEVDSETKKDFLEGYIFTLQLGDKDNQFVIDAECNDITIFKDLLENKLLLFQNAKYDLKFLLKLNIRPKLVYDCFIVECILTTGLQDRKLGLDALVEKYTDGQLDKSVRGVINYEGLTDRVIEYARLDVRYLGEIRDKQLIQVYELGLENLVWLENMVVFVFTEMEYYGMYLDQEQWLVQARESELEAVKYKEVLDNYILTQPEKFNRFIDRQLDLFNPDLSTNINWNSSAQLIKVFAADGLILESVNEKEIQSIQHSLVKLYLDFKNYQTQISKFGVKFLRWAAKDSRVRTSYWQLLETGRVSSGQKDKFPNVQQIPANNKFRNCFKPEKGYLYVDCDYSSMELAIAAIVSEEESWVEGYRNKWDLHSTVAETVFKDRWANGTEETCLYTISKLKCECKVHKPLRNNIKTLNYLSIFGGGANKLAKSVNISVSEAKDIISKYFKGLPKLKAKLTFLGDYAVKFRYMRTMKPFRRIRWFSNSTDDETIASIRRQGANSHIQGSAADIVKLAMVMLYEYRNRHNLDVKFVVQQHDAIVAEVKEDFAEEWLKITKRIMRLASLKVLGTLAIDVDGYVDSKWRK